MSKYIFPVALIVLDIGDAIVYGFNGDIRNVVYLIGEAILNLSVTF